MAESKKVKGEDIIESKLFDGAKKSAKEFSKTLDDLVKGFKKIVAEQQKFLLQNKDNVKLASDVKKLNEAIQKSTEARKALTAAEQVRVKLEEQDLKLQKERQKVAQEKLKTDKLDEELRQKKLKGLRDEKKEADNTAKAADKLKIANERLNSVYGKQSKQLLEMKKRVKDLLASDKELTEEEKKLVKETQALDDKLKKIDKTLGDGHRTVGLYADGIKEAIAGTRLFDGEIAHTLVQLKNLQKQWKENTEGANKFSNGLKLVGVGLAIVAVAALIKLLDAGTEASQKLSDEFEKINPKTIVELSAAVAASKLAGFNADLGQAVLLMRQLIDETTKQTKVLEELSLVQQQLTLDEEDFKQISEDTTIGFEARNIALKEAQKLEKEKLEKALEASKIILGLADLELKKEEAKAGTGNARLEFYKKQNEALKAVRSAEDALSDTVRLNDEAQRQFNIEHASVEIDLLLKKKQSANAEKVILENRLEDEKRQLEQRRKDAAALNRVNKQTTSEEIKLFKQKTGIEFDEKKLIGEQDAILLQRKLEGIKQTVVNQKGENEQVGIGTDAIVLLSKIIKTAQENRIANAQTIKKLDEEELARNQKLAEIKKEIAIITQESIVESTEQSAEKQKEASDKANEDILNQEGVFEKKKVKRRRILAEQALAKEQEVIDQREELLKLQREKDLQAIEDSVSDEKIKAAEKLKINTKYYEDLAKLGAEARANELAFQDKEVEELRKREIRRTEIVVEKLQAVTTALQEEIRKQNDKRLEGIDQELEDREKAIERQTQLAEDGKQNQLAFEIAAQKKAELEKKEIEERAQREEEILQLTDAYFNALNARLKEPGANPNNAAYLALGDVLLARGVAKGLVQFAADGNNMIEGPGTTTSDSIPFMLSKKEAVIKASENIKHNDAVVALNSGMFDQLFMPRIDMDNYSAGDNAILNAQALSLFAEMNEKLEAINNKPVQMWALDKFGQWVEKRVSAKFTENITHVPPRHNFHS